MNKERANHPDYQLIRIIGLFIISLPLAYANIRQGVYESEQDFQGVLEGETIHVRAYNVIPWECYTQEHFDRHSMGIEYPLAIELVMRMVPRLDPLKNTWRYYEDFVKEHSTPDSYDQDGNPVYINYILPDVDHNSRVCGQCVGEYPMLPAPSDNLSTDEATYYWNTVTMIGNLCKAGEQE